MGHPPAVNRDVHSPWPLNQSQVDALVDFTFNEGSGRLYSSTLLKVINGGGSVSMQDFTMYDLSGKPPAFNPGLLNRRTAEYSLFSTGNYGGGP